MIPEASKPLFERLGQKPIIRIKEDQKVTVASTTAAVTRRCNAEILLAKAPDARVTRSNFRRVVRCPIVHNDDLNMWVGLREHALDRLAQKVSLVITRYDDRHESAL